MKHWKNGTVILLSSPRVSVKPCGQVSVLLLFFFLLMAIFTPFPAFSTGLQSKKNISISPVFLVKTDTRPKDPKPVQPAKKTKETGETRKTNDPKTKPSGLRLTGGIATGFPIIPVESDLMGDGFPIEIFSDIDFGDWPPLRVGFNRSEASTDGVTLTTSVLYIAYRYPFPITGKVNGLILGGLGNMNGTLKTSGNPATSKGSTMGLTTGIGLDIPWKKVLLSLEYRLFFGEAKIGAQTLNLGSNQVLMAARYQFY